MALAVYGVAVTWMVGAAFWSVPPQVFAGRADPAGTADDRICPGSLARLEAELYADALGALEPGDRRPVPRERWWRAWDAEHASLAELCGGRWAEAHRDLGRLRYRVQALVDRFQGETGALARSVHEQLAAPSEKPPENELP
ncbi:MAG TPA: hypothetical protein RMF84_12320 [Polyangiaceae bacterium LLY-WYZ-14_1]|nr:hypothetical protein [Polyangiaceae bacterium LLY-WYZ-14_1]